jgi:hypothetical protein
MLGVPLVSDGAHGDGRWYIFLGHHSRDARKIHRGKVGDAARAETPRSWWREHALAIMACSDLCVWEGLGYQAGESDMV